MRPHAKQPMQVVLLRSTTVDPSARKPPLSAGEKGGPPVVVLPDDAGGVDGAGVAVAVAEVAEAETQPVEAVLPEEGSRLAPNRLHDRGVHPVCDLVGRVDRDRVEAGFSQSRFVFGE